MSAKLNRSPFVLGKDGPENIIGRLKLVADETRLRILSLLSTGPHNVTAICEFTNMTQPAISHHLSLLRVSGIVDNQRNGKSMIYSVTDLGWNIINGIRGHISA